MNEISELNNHTPKEFGASITREITVGEKGKDVKIEINTKEIEWWESENEIIEFTCNFAPDASESEILNTPFRIWKVI